MDRLLDDLRMILSRFRCLDSYLVSKPSGTFGDQLCYVQKKSLLPTLFLRKSKGFLFARTYLGTNNANTRCFYQRSRTVTVLYQAVAQVLCKLVLT